MLMLQVLSALASDFALPADPFLPPPPPLFHCGACGFSSGGSFIHTLTAETNAKGRWGVGVRFDWQEFDAFSTSELSNFANQGVETHSLERSFVLRASANYAVGDDWTFGLDLPIASNRGLRETAPGGSPNIEDDGDQTGVGDLSLFGQWCFLRDAEREVYSSLYFGSKLPTGDQHQKASDGSLLEPDHQPGSGSMDPFVGVALGKSWGKTTLGASVLYTFAGHAAQDSNLGDVLRVNVGFGYEPEKREDSAISWRWMLELNGQWHDRMKIDDVVDTNSGGEQLFLAPGVRATTDSGVSWFASIGVPLAQNLYGEQSDTAFRASVGVGFVF